MLRHRPSASGPTVPRWRLIALILSAGALAVILVAGVVLSAVDLAGRVLADSPATPTSSIHPTPDPLPAGPVRLRAVTAAEARARDALAARAMPQTGTGAPYGRPDLSTRDPGEPIVLPAARGEGAYGVGVGFPQTPAGALAQLAAIDIGAFRQASLAGARAVIRQWAAPGGPTPSSWSGVRAMRALLESTGAAADGSARLAVRARAPMGLIKGRIGDDFVLACVDLSIDITFGGTSPAVAADCQRMVWVGDRWLIGPGPEPASAPSVWPGTDAAIDAGYTDLVVVGGSATGRG